MNPGFHAAIFIPTRQCRVGGDTEFRPGAENFFNADAPGREFFGHFIRALQNEFAAVGIIADPIRKPD